MYKNLFGVASVISSIGFLIWSIGQATAFPQGPSVNLGVNPVVNYRGSVTGYNGATIFTSPSDQATIVTTILTVSDNSGTLSGGVYCDVYLDGTKIIDGYYSWTHISTYNSGNDSGNNPTPFKLGQAKLKVEPNSTLSMRASGGNSMICNYYIEGYQVTP